MNRHVCLKDLEGYLKRSDYLNGFTKVEQQQIRQNIGALGKDGGSDKDLMFECSYDMFYSIMRNNLLEVGKLYIINDYKTIYLSNTDEIWGDQAYTSTTYTIIARAIAKNKIDHKVTILSAEYPNSSKWIVYYDPEPKILKDGIKNMGTIYYLQDTNNNSAYYDFKNVKTFVSRDMSQLEYSRVLYTFNTQDFKDASETHNVKNNQFGPNAVNNVFLGACKNNIFEADFKNNIFIDKCENNHFLSETYNNIFNKPVIYVSGRVCDKIISEFTDLDISKTLNKVYQGYTLSYIDYDTLSLQVHEL